MVPGFINSFVKKWFDLIMVFIWILLLIPTVLWWKDSVMWVAIMSIYNNVVGHWGSHKAGKSEEVIREKLND